MAEREIAGLLGVDPEPPNSITGTSTSRASTPRHPVHRLTEIHENLIS